MLVRNVTDGSVCATSHAVYVSVLFELIRMLSLSLSLNAIMVEPLSPGTARIPSTCFCLLHKFFLMRLTMKQMQGLLKHVVGSRPISLNCCTRSHA